MTPSVPLAAAARGRKLDASRDAVILDAAVNLLAEVGYDGLTMDLVAARAQAGKATVYRRWSSKAEMVLDAVRHLKAGVVDLERLPDTGTLRGDLLGLFRPSSVEESERKMRALAGLATMISRQPLFAEAGHLAIIAPWVEANRTLIRRSVARGEASAGADVEALAHIIPSLTAYRALIQRRPFERAYLVELLDGVLLPALGIIPPDAAAAAASLGHPNP